MEQAQEDVKIRKPDMHLQIGNTKIHIVSPSLTSAEKERVEDAIQQAAWRIIEDLWVQEAEA